MQTLILSEKGIHLGGWPCKELPSIKRLHVLAVLDRDRTLVIKVPNDNAPKLPFRCDINLTPACPWGHAIPLLSWDPISYLFLPLKQNKGTKCHTLIWMVKLWYHYTMDYYSGRASNRLLIYTTICMNFKRHFQNWKKKHILWWFYL